MTWGRIGSKLLPLEVLHVLDDLVRVLKEIPTLNWKTDQLTSLLKDSTHRPAPLAPLLRQTIERGAPLSDPAR